MGRCVTFRSLKPNPYADDERDIDPNHSRTSGGNKYIEYFLRPVVESGEQEEIVINQLLRRMLRIQNLCRCARAGKSPAPVP